MRPVVAPVATIGRPQAVALYVGAVLGAGVLILPGTSASAAGPAAIAAWAFVCAASMPIALTLAALATRHPDAGGVATFARLAFSPAAGASIGWFYFTAASVGQAVVVLTGGYYVAAAVGTGEDGAVALGAVFLTIAVAANCFGLRVSGRLQLALSAGVGVILLAGVAAALPEIELSAFSPFAPEGAIAVGSAAIPLFFAFAGWEAVTHLAGEFCDPGRDLTWATRVSVGLVALLYLGVVMAVVGTGTYGDDEVDRAAVAELLGASLGVGAKQAAGVAAAVITLATANAFVAAGSRLAYALGRDGAMPRAVGRLSRRQVPVVGVAAVGAVGMAGLLVAWWTGMGAEDLVVLPSTLVLATYLVAMASGLRLLEGAERRRALGALLLCAAMVPFAGGWALVPLALTGMVAAIGGRRGFGSPTG